VVLFRNAVRKLVHDGFYVALEKIWPEKDETERFNEGDQHRPRCS